MTKTAAGLTLAASVVALAAPAITPAAQAKAATKYYVSLGDSYSVGYQPSPTPAATNGFTVPVAAKEKLTLANFGCGGATTLSILNTNGCTSPYGPTASKGAIAYSTTTQEAAAVAFIKAHPGQIGLITVSIGGNDVTHCATDPNPITCVGNAQGAITTNVTQLVSDLQAAAGTSVPLIGLTYPDVLLGLWVCDSATGKAPCAGGSPNQTLAGESTTAFSTLINPALKKAYTGGGGNTAFVDVTTDTGAYTPTSKTTTLKPWGKIPVAVADVCKLTWYCTLANIHANTTGYNDIAKFIEAQYASMPHV